jgi:hypothetical protein
MEGWRSSSSSAFVLDATLENVYTGVALSSDNVDEVEDGGSKIYQRRVQSYAEAIDLLNELFQGKVACVGPNSGVEGG